MRDVKYMATLEQVKAIHKILCEQARDIIETKGHDYNLRQQDTGETLFNLKVAKLLGITDSNTQSILVRMSDKMMRLISLTRDPKVTASVKDESIRDTIKDLINYSCYLYIMYNEERDNEISPTQKDT